MFRYTNSISTLTRHKRPKHSKTPAIAVLAVIGVFCCSGLAFGHDDKVTEQEVSEIIDELERQKAHYELKERGVCEDLDRLIADELAWSLGENLFPYKMVHWN